jgi:2-dehydropantoate 2-reductase
VAYVTLLGTWAEAIYAIREHGILLEDSKGSHNIKAHAEFLGTQVLPAELAVILVKSWQTAKIAEYISRNLKPEGLAVSLQNGLGNVELLGGKVFPGTTSEGATLLGPGHIKGGGSGPTYIAAPEWAVEIFSRAGFESHSCSPNEADSLLWGKLAISCGINALTALLRIPNGELLKTPTAADLMAKAARECASVAQACGIKLPFADAAAKAREAAERTAGNKSSMLQDLLRGAPTECDAINGAVVREGKRLNVPTPVNEVLFQLIQAATHKNEGR